MARSFKVIGNYHNEFWTNVGASLTLASIPLRPTSVKKLIIICEWQRYKDVRLNKPDDSLPEQVAFGSTPSMLWCLSFFFSCANAHRFSILSKLKPPMVSSGVCWDSTYSHIKKDHTKSRSQSDQGNALMMAYHTHRSHLLRLFVRAFSGLELDDRWRLVLHLCGGGYAGSVGPKEAGVSAIPIPPGVVPAWPTGSTISSSLSLMFTHWIAVLIVELSPIVVATGTLRDPSGTLCSHAASIGEKNTPACCAAARSSNISR